MTRSSKFGILKWLPFFSSPCLAVGSKMFRFRIEPIQLSYRLAHLHGHEMELSWKIHNTYETNIWTLPFCSEFHPGWWNDIENSIQSYSIGLRMYFSNGLRKYVIWVYVQNVTPVVEIISKIEPDPSTLGYGIFLKRFGGFLKNVPLIYKGNFFVHHKTYLLIYWPVCL